MVVRTASPGITTNEVDLTRGTIDAFTSNIGAFAGPFEKGPVGKAVLINSEAEFQRTFGNPNDLNYEYWWTVNNFLDYGGICYVIRCDDSAESGELKNACDPNTDEGDAILVKNEEDFLGNYKGNSEQRFLSRTAGTWGNALGIAVIDRGADYRVALKTEGGIVAATGVADPTARWSAALPAGSMVGEYRVIRFAEAANINDVEPGTTVSVDSAIVAHVIEYHEDSNSMLVIVTDPTEGILDIATETKVGDNTEYFIQDSYQIGTFQLYKSEVIVLVANEIIKHQIDINWIPGTVSLEDGINKYQWPAFPTDGQKKYTEGQYAFVYSANYGVWVATYNLKENDPFFDGTNVFQVQTSVDWYKKQIAFLDVPWTRFAKRPTTTTNAIERGAANDGMNIIVYDLTGELTGSKYNVLEQYYGVSKLSGAKTQEGENNYYVDQINRLSNYIYADAPLVGTGHIELVNDTFGADPVGTTIGVGVKTQYIDVETIHLAHGVDNFNVTIGEIQNAYDRFTIENIADLDYILAGPGFNTDRLDENYADESPTDDLNNTIAKVNFLIGIAEDRRDCILFVSPPRHLIVGQTDSERITDSLVEFSQQLSSSSYTVFDSGYKYTYDRFSDKYRYVPLNGDVAGLMAYTSIVAEPWYSPAGLSRGQIRNVVKLPYNPTKKQRDQLFSERINPVVTFPGEGTVLFGDKTALGYSSAFDRINVRKLFLVVERAIAASSRTNLFEFNDEITRTLFKNNVDPFLRNIQSRRGMQDFLVVCDASNNTPEIIDRNEFVADIYIKPARSINYITLNFIATKSGVTFDESVGLFRGTNQSTNR